MVLLEQLFVTKSLSKSIGESESLKNSYQRVQMIEVLLKYEFINDLDAQSDFDKKIVTKKPVK